MQRENTGYAPNRQTSSTPNPPAPPAPPTPPRPPVGIAPRGFGLDYVNVGGGIWMPVSSLPQEAQDNYWRNIWASGQWGPNPNDKPPTNAAPAPNQPPTNIPQDGYKGPDLVNQNNQGNKYPTGTRPTELDVYGNPVMPVGPNALTMTVPAPGAAPAVNAPAGTQITYPTNEYDFHPNIMSALPGNTQKSPTLGLGQQMNPADFVFNSPDWMARLQQLFLNMQNNAMPTIGQAINPIGTQAAPTSTIPSSVQNRPAPRPGGGLSGGAAGIRLFTPGMRGGGNGVADYTNAGLGRGVFT